MSLILRNVKGSPLTYTEMDNNLVYLEGLGITGSTNGLANVLFNNNTTGGNDIVLSNGDVIEAASGGGQLDLRYGGADNEVMLSNDGGAYSDELVYLSPGYIEIAGYATGGQIYIYSDVININSKYYGLMVSDLTNNFDYQLRFGNDGYNDAVETIVTDYNNGLNCWDKLTGATTERRVEETSDLAHYSRIAQNISSVTLRAQDNATYSQILMTKDDIEIDGNVIISDNRAISAENGGGQLDLRYGGNDDEVMLSNDGGAFGDSQLNLTTGYVELSCYGTSSIISGLELDPESNSNGTRLYKEDTSSGAKTILTINTSFGEIRSEAGSGDYEVAINVDGSTGLASLITYDYAGDRVDALELDPTLTNLGTRLYSEDTNSGDISEVKLEPTQIILESQATLKGNTYSSRIENIIGNIDIICENQTSGEVGSVLLNTTGEVLIVGNDGIDTSSIFVGGVNISIETVELLLPLISTYADNAAAISGGLVADTVYKTATGELRIVI